MAVEVRDVALEHYSASAVLVRFPNGAKVWLPLSQINQVPTAWALPESMAQRRGKVLVITDWIAKQKGFKITPRELDIDPERVTDKPTAPTQVTKPELLVNAKPAAVAALEQQVERQGQELAAKRVQLCQVQLECARLRSGMLSAEAQRDKAVADLALAQDALRKANERADKAEAYIAAQGHAEKNLPQERFALIELE